MLDQLAILLIGYSLFGGLAVIVTHFSAANYVGRSDSRWLGILLVLGLMALQGLHFLYLYSAFPIFTNTLYLLLLFFIAPLFYLFSAPLLTACATRWPGSVWHFAPPLAVFASPPDLARPLAFLIGAGYLLALGKQLYGLRAERMHYRRELWMIGGIFAIALLVALLAIGLPVADRAAFVALYASAIGGAFLLLNLLLARSPHLASEVPEVARQVYARSTLGGVDTDGALARLRDLMVRQHVYRDADLNLGGLSAELGLSAHQLSELINTRLGMNFSRYLRELRVEEAKQLLISQPSRSVIDISQQVGFSSQSNFYAAFRELVGMAPAQFRKLQRQSPG
jgi:AraC-like DNA-binding protein